MATTMDRDDDDGSRWRLRWIEMTTTMDRDDDYDGSR